MPYAEINNIKLYYDDHGDGQPLVLVHGFSSSGELWTPFIPPFKDRYRIIVPDLRGHGYSTGEPETMNHRRFAEDIIALLNHLQIDQAHLVGHSSGGMCFLFIGIDYPHRVHSLSLISATYTFDEYARNQMRNIAAELENDTEGIAESNRIHGPTHGEDYWKVLREVFLTFTTNPDELLSDPEDMNAIRCPVLIMHGDRDEIFPVNIPVTMYKSLPNSELCILQNTTHALPAERPTVFLMLLEDFLKRVQDSK
ncbi:MAG: alpha/beta fold hydrolase [Anaerolineales bacterium]|nr:alpha/beta fold hydrolase [Anaerolineales bacterium]